MILSGLHWRADSPSLLHLTDAPVSIGYDGTSWLIHIAGQWGTREFRTREQAAQLVATAFTNARENLNGTQI